MRFANLSWPRPGVFPRHLARLGPWIARALPYLDLTTPRATYVMRSLMAAALALVIAYWLDLRAPYSAASTVLLVINPVQGAVIGKGVWRVLGTLAGMLAAIVLMSAFGQSPWLFLLGFGAWVGVCVAGMTLLRHFQAYGATLAGYTVGLAAAGAMQHPELTFDQVTGRGAAVLIGVACLAIVSAVFSTRGVRSRLETHLRRLASSVADILATNHQAIHCDGAAGARPLDAGRRNLIVDVYGVDDLLALGKFESADLAQRAAAVRHAMVSLFSALVGGTPPMRQGSASLDALRSLQPAWEQAWQQASQALAQEQDSIGVARAMHALAGLRAQALALLGKTSLDEPAEHAALTIAGDRLIEQLDDYLAALDGLRRFHQHRPAAPTVAVPFHRDTRAACVNGLRALLTVVLGGAFWIATGWTNGNLMLAGLAAASALLGTAPNPPLGAVAFIKGTVFAVAMAFLCSFIVLPHIAGLPLLLVVLGLFWLPGVYATTVPRHALTGVAYLVAFTTLAAVDNPMRYDFAAFLNASAAWILATCFTLLGFRIVLPRNPARDVARLRRAIRDEALGTLRGKPANARAWQWRQQHRTAQLGAMLRSQPQEMERSIADALAGMHLGREVLRVRDWLRRQPADSAPAGVVAAALRHMRRRAFDPRLAARRARRAAQSLARLPLPQQAAHADAQRLVVLLLDIAALLDAHADYFSPHPGGHADAQ